MDTHGKSDTKVAKAAKETDTNRAKEEFW